MFEYESVCVRDTSCSRIELSQGEGDLKPTVDMGKNSTAPIVDEKDDDDDDDVEKARILLQRELMKYLDTVKSRAFQSVFLEPAKFHIGGDHDVEIHGANYYGAVLCSTLGVRCPRLIHASDWCRGGLVTFRQRCRSQSKTPCGRMKILENRISSLKVDPQNM